MGRGSGIPEDAIACSRHERQVLDRILDRFEQLRPEDAWTCDGGAAVLADMLEHQQIRHSLRIGLFAPGSEQEEHHHWIEIEEGQDGSRAVLIDPNAELRGRPRLQLLTADVRRLYQPHDELNSRFDRELMSFSPLWDPEAEELVSIEELDDSGVQAYLATIKDHQGRSDN